jgi:hypothetical protein
VGNSNGITVIGNGRLSDRSGSGSLRQSDRVCRALDCNRDGSLGTPVGHRDDTQTKRAVDDLVSQALAHEADADADRPTLICARHRRST